MKRIVNIIGCCIMIVALTACAGSVFQISHASPQELTIWSAQTLVHVYTKSKSRNIRDELIRRNVFTTEEWGRIDDRSIRIGDRELVLYASFGEPYTINTTSMSNTIQKQYVYDHDGAQYAFYIYTTDGIVTDIQKYEQVY